MKDDELLARLRAADPAATASAPTPDINRLVEVAMTAEHQNRVSRAGTPMPTQRPVHRRRGFALAAATAALLLVGGGAVWKAVVDHGGPANHRTPPSRPLALTLQTGADAKCMGPTVDLLREFEVAFEGSVTSQEDDQVVFRIDHWFRGGDAATARLANDGSDGGSENLVFQVGQRYLVTALDGVVPVCGGTNLATPEGEELFHRAFDR